MNESNDSTIWKLMNEFKLQVDPSSINDDMSCMICKNLMIDACFSVCGCQYCRKCINEYVGDRNVHCPGNNRKCREEFLSLDTEVFSDKRMNNRIFKSKVICPNKSCTAKIELAQIHEHLKVCSIDLTTRPYLTIDCDNGAHLLDNCIHNLNNEVDRLKSSLEMNRLEIVNLKEDSKMKDNKIGEIIKETTDSRKDMDAQITKLCIEIESMQENSQIEISEIVQRIEKHERAMYEQMANLYNEMESVKQNSKQEISKMVQKMDEQKRKMNEQEANIKKEMTSVKQNSKQEQSELAQRMDNQKKEMNEQMINLKKEMGLVKPNSKQKEINEIFQLMDKQKREINEHLTNLKKQIESVNKNSKKQINDVDQQLDKQKKETNEVMTNLKKEIKSVKEDKIATLEEQLVTIEEREKLNKETEELIFGMINDLTREMESLKVIKAERQIIDKTKIRMNEWIKSYPNIDADFITEWTKKRQTLLKKYILSESFYSNNYKLCLCLCINNDNNIWLDCSIMKGDSDDDVRWPMRHNVTISIINQDTLEMYKRATFQFDTYTRNKSAFERPICDINDCGIGSNKLIKYWSIKDNPSIIANDSLIVSCILTDP